MSRCMHCQAVLPHQKGKFCQSCKINNIEDGYNKKYVVVTKSCAKCKEIKPIDTKISSNYCKECYEQINFPKSNLMSMSEFKDKLYCYLCGYNRCRAAIHLHHMDRKKKKYIVSTKHKVDYQAVVEIRKCVPVCAVCHIEIEKGMVDTTAVNDAYYKFLEDLPNYININELDAEPTRKKCIGCHKTKAITSFYKRNKYYQSLCKTCHKQQTTDNRNKAKSIRNNSKRHTVTNKDIPQWVKDKF